MIFNPEIESKLRDMEGNEVISTEQIGLCKLILFSFQNQLNLPNYSSVNLETLQELTTKLVFAGLIERDYDEKGNVQLSKSLYIDASEVIQSALNTTNIKSFVEANFDTYRAIFSKKNNGTVGLRTGSLGDKQAGIDKMVKWFKKTKFRHTWEEVLKATQYYVSLQKPNNYKYLQNADYFIYKDNRSNLSTYIEESKNPSTNTDWNREHI